MKSSLLQPSRICGIWWAMAEKWPASLWQVCIRGRPSPWRQASLLQITQPAKSESCVFLSEKAVGHRQKTGIHGVPGSHLVISPSGLSLFVACEQPGGVEVVSVVEAWMWVRLHCTSWSREFPGNRDTAHSFAQVQSWGLMKPRKPDTASLTTVACTDSKNPSFSVATLVFFIESGLIFKRTLETKKERPLIWNKWKAWRG